MVFGYVAYLGLLAVSAGAVLYGLVLVGEGFREWREFNALVDVPVVPLDGVAVGEAAVSGTIRPNETPTTVPVGDERCVCYEIRVSDSTDASPVHEERDSVSFSVDDGDGRVRLDPGGFELDLTGDRTESFSFKSYDDIPERASAFHETRDLPERGMRRDRTIEYSYLRPGDEVFAYGRVRPDAETNAHGKAVVLTAGESGFLSNKPLDALQRERRHALVKSAVTGVVVSTLGLGGVLWLSGFAQLFLGA